VFIVDSLPVAILLCVVTMLGWGSWANTQKLAGKDAWPFPLYYWDYAFGVLFLGIVFAFTLGSFGSTGMSAASNLATASPAAIWRAALSGALFNVSNILLVVAIDAAGMSVAFPLGVGLALVIGTVGSFAQAPQGNPLLLFVGVGLVVGAMILSAMAYRRLPRQHGARWHRGVWFAIAAGGLMGSFYPQLALSITPEFTRGVITPGLLTPYAAIVCFGVGLVASNVLVNTIFMRAAGVTYADYLAGSLRLHSLGFLGGIIWMLALGFNVLASGVAGPAISYALGQGAVLVAAIWGVFIWREFRHAPTGTVALIGWMFVAYSSGLLLIGMATL
jgi:glucose uptake protein